MKTPIEEIVAYRKEQCKKEIESLDLTYLAENQLSDDEIFRLNYSCLHTCSIASLIERDHENFRRFSTILLKSSVKKTRLDIKIIEKGKIVGNVSDQGCTDLDDLSYYATFDLQTAIFHFFNDHQSSHMIRSLEWAVESTDMVRGLSDETLLKTYSPYNIPRAFAIRGYALTLLNRYQEALEVLEHVMPLTRAGKQRGEWMGLQAEYALPYALIPLCEYRLDPTEQKRIAAWKGREEYMNRITRDECRFDSYLYYYHLEEAYPDVYQPPVKRGRRPVDQKDTKKRVPEVLTEIPDYAESKRLDEPGDGGVVVQDNDDNEWNFVFRVPSFERFIEKIIALGKYPALSDSLNAYAFSTPLDPEAVIHELNLLLKEPSLTIEEREAVGEIGKIAMHARDHGAEILFQYNEYW